MIKKCILPVISVLLAILSVIFCVLWRTEANDHNELFRLAQSSVQNSYQCFNAYSTNGNEEDYWSGVAEFRVFEQSYYILNGEIDPNYLYCNAIYGYMVDSPDAVKHNIPELMHILGLLANDINDMNGYIRMSSLEHLLSGKGY